MRRDCKNCSKWEKYFYWNHRNLTKVCFCMKMDASSFMKKLDLPNHFRRHFNGQIGENVELKGPSGNIWRVGVIKSAEKFTFQSGWKDFVIANNVEANDVLVFKYSSSSSFQVQIFVSSGCERISSFFLGPEETEVQESTDNSSVNIFEAPGPNAHQKNITLSGSSSDSEFSSGTEPEKMSRGRASTRNISKESSGRGKFKARNNVQITFPHRLFLSPAQKERVLQLSEEIQPENHCFGILMTHNMLVVQQKVGIPAKFANKHLPQHAKNAILHQKGRTCSLSLKIYSSPTRAFFISGWAKFVKANSLQEGDICMFELVMVEKDAVSFKVHISRK